MFASLLRHRLSRFVITRMEKARRQISTGVPNRRTRTASFGRCALVLIALALSASIARAQKLSIQSDRFAVDGTPRFLTFMSYFAGMGAPDIVSDLRTMRRLGFDGFRIWPNLDGAPQLMNADGSLRPEGLARLQLILDQARVEHLIVDVTFTREHVPGMTAAAAKLGIVAATEALRSYDNILFDIQNERNVGDRRFMSETDVAAIFAAVKATDSARITTASMSPASDAAETADFTARLRLDVTAYHEPRTPDWYTLAAYQRVVGTMKRNGRPAYLQESMSTRDSLFSYPAHDRAEYFLEAIANAKLAGAAAWCFHTDVAVGFQNGPPLLEDRLRAYPEPEWAFVNSLVPRVTFRTDNAINYLVAEAGGGAGVRADRTAAGPGSWTVFTVVSTTGGPLVSGDRVAFMTADGKHYLQAVGGGGAALAAGADSIGPAETFTLERLASGVIQHSDPIALRASDTPWLVVAEGGGGGNVMVNSASRGGSESFTIFFATPHQDPASLGPKNQFEGPRRDLDDRPRLRRIFGSFH
jgi:hypothetical protein